MSDWNELSGILEQALDASGADRARLLDRLCADPDRRREIEALLAREHDGRFDPPGHGVVEGLVAALEGARLVGRSAGPYRLTELIATGGMGEVYRAARDDGAFERTVAVKVIRRSVMSPGAARRFSAERRLLARLSHPNIAGLLDGGEIDGRPFLVLEHVEGDPLRVYCTRHRLDTAARARLMRTVCAAVAHAHRNLIVHRDLKPSNLLVTADGTPKLLDFGISKLLGGDGEDPTLTSARMLTPRYASPEQLRGEPVTTASDVYSLGVILHETLTGRAWGVAADGTQRTPQLNGEIEPPSRAATLDCEGIDRELDAIVMQALEPDASRRYPSAEAMGADLQRWLDGERVLAFTASRTYRARKWAARHRVALSGAAALGAIVTTAGALATLMAARLAAERAQTLAARADAEQTTRFLAGVIESAGERAIGGPLTLGSLLDDAVARLDRDLPRTPGVAGPARLALARAYLGMGRSADGERLQRHAVADLERAHGAADARTSRAREELGATLTLAGRFDEAEAEFARALSARRADPGHDEADLVAGLHGLGRMELIRRRDAEADRYLREALAIAERRAREADAATVLDTLGWLEMTRGRVTEAVAARERSLEIRRRLHPPESPEVARALAALGEACHLAGDLVRAESLLRQSHESTCTAQGPARAVALPAFRALCRVIEARGDLPTAEAMYLAGVAELEGGLPASRHNWVYLRENYAMFLERAGRRQEARPHFELAAQTYEELLGADHLRTVMAGEAAQRCGSGG